MRGRSSPVRWVLSGCKAPSRFGYAVCGREQCFADVVQKNPRMSWSHRQLTCGRLILQSSLIYQSDTVFVFPIPESGLDSVM